MKWVVLLLVLLAGCSSTRPGGYYKDDGPPIERRRTSSRLSTPCPRRAAAQVRKPSVHRFRARLRAHDIAAAFRQRGLASWYGKRYHGKNTSSGETYDMYAMTAAHPTLPIPSYARVTNVGNGRSVVLRINDRGPFRSGA